VELEQVITNPAAILALAEAVCPSLNGASSYRLSAALESIDAGTDLTCEPDFSQVIDAGGALDPRRVAHWAEELERLDADLVTVVDDRYPANLRMIHDHPPFLFVRGTLDGAETSIALVGTRNPSPQGQETVRRLAQQLVEEDITVVSGLAAGIDTAAHESALEAGGRTLAVLGTGILRTYPASNRDLAARIPQSGAVLSQFWPDMAPTRWSFPVRNIVTSGLSLGTVVVEAGPTSGARQQAEHALRHGKRLFLMRGLVEDQAWAQSMLEEPGAVAIDGLDEVLEAIDAERRPQLDLLV
jgi:DNA processing protein